MELANILTPIIAAFVTVVGVLVGVIKILGDNAKKHNPNGALGVMKDLSAKIAEDHVKVREDHIRLEGLLNEACRTLQRIEGKMDK